MDSLFGFASYSNYYYYSFRVSYRNILPVAGILIPLFGSQVKNKRHLHLRHLASYLVYESEGVV